MQTTIKFHKKYTDDAIISKKAIIKIHRNDKARNKGILKK